VGLAVIATRRRAAEAALVLLLGCGGSLLAAPRCAAEGAGLVLETKIPLGQVSGRIDHLAVDLEHQRLFVAELGNDAVGVIDLRGRQVLRTLSGLNDPQGVGYVPASDTLYVANAGDGSVRLFEGPELVPAGRIALDEDADNVRVDEAADRVYVGYGNGALAVIDAAKRVQVADIRLDAHPEGFQLDPKSARIFVNLPDARQIAVVDRHIEKQIVGWQVPGVRGNFPMALDPAGRRIVLAFRRPARLVALAAVDGSVIANVESCGDADDVFLDAKRQRIYLSCGEGFVDVFAVSDGYARIARLPTPSGARTSLFVPALDRFYLAVRASMSEPAAIWVYRPTP
jgi:DNA-binding beta-propeller fold protein YncE